MRCLGREWPGQTEQPGQSPGARVSLLFQEQPGPVQPCRRQEVEAAGDRELRGAVHAGLCDMWPLLLGVRGTHGRVFGSGRTRSDFHF